MVAVLIMYGKNTNYFRYCEKKRIVFFFEGELVSCINSGINQLVLFEDFCKSLSFRLPFVRAEPEFVEPTSPD